MSESDKLRKHELECMRLAADCMQLVGDVRSPALQRHFLWMARVWTIKRNGARARRPRPRIQLNGFTQPTRSLCDSRPAQLFNARVMCAPVTIRFLKAEPALRFDMHG